MPNDNATLKTLIMEARDACRLKTDTLNRTDPAVARVIEDLHRTFDKFKADGIWVHPIPYDEPKLLQHILFIRTLTDGDTSDFIREAEELISFLEEILKEPVQWLAQAGTSDWNLKMLEALRKIRGAVTRKKKSLAEAGEDPMEKPGFPEMDEEFNTLIDDYRAKLKENEVQANENDIKSVGLMEQLLNSAGTAAKFIQYFKLLIKFLKEKTGA